MMPETGLPVQKTGKGEPILMIHGIISDGSFFSGLQEQLKDEFQMISYDRRGYGRDIDSEYDSYSVATQVEDAVEIIKNNTDEPVWILGNSAGGIIGAQLCIKYPQLCKGLILLESTLVCNDASWQLMNAWNEELNGYAEERKFHKALQAFTQRVGGKSKAKDVNMRKLGQTLKNLNNFMQGEMNEIQRYKPELSELRNISIPVTMLVTKEGRDKIFGLVSYSAAENIGWPVVICPGNHNVIEDEPEAMANIIRDIIMGNDNN